MEAIKDLDENSADAGVKGEHNFPACALIFKVNLKAFLWKILSSKFFFFKVKTCLTPQLSQQLECLMRQYTEELIQ